MKVRLLLGGRELEEGSAAYNLVVAYYGLDFVQRIRRCKEDDTMTALKVLEQAGLSPVCRRDGDKLKWVAEDAHVRVELKVDRFEELTPLWCLEVSVRAHELMEIVMSVLNRLLSTSDTYKYKFKEVDEELQWLRKELMELREELQHLREELRELREDLQSLELMVRKEG